MKELQLSFYKDLENRLKKYYPTALFGLLFGTILYSMLMFLQLTNTFDGLWHQNYHYAGHGELTSGRWMLYFIEKLSMGLHAEPITSLLALSLFVLGFIVVLELFGVENKFASFLCMALWISSTVICNTLSYRYTSIGYGIAFLLAVLGVFISLKGNNKIVSAVVSGILLGLSMACYQTYLGVFCIVAVFYLLKECGKKEESREASDNGFLFSFLLRIVCTAAVGAVFYLVSLFSILKVANASLSSYNGINSITPLGLITGLPENICKTYRYFGTYFLTDTLKVNRLQYFGGHYVLLALLAGLILLIGIRVWKINRLRILILIPTVLAIPVACNAYMLIVGDKLELQMTAGLAILVPLTMILAFSYIQRSQIIRIACTVFAAALLYGNIMQVRLDQEAMYEGTNACETMMTQVISDLQASDLLSAEYEYLFIGVPARNEFFSVSDHYVRANGYAQIGNFWTSGNCLQPSYHGLISHRMGFELPLSDLLPADVVESYDLNGKADFPHDGYITVFDDNLVVIKISDYEKYSEYSLYIR